MRENILMKTYKMSPMSLQCICNACRRKKKYLKRDEIKRFIQLIIRLTKITGKDLFKIPANIIMWFSLF